MDDFVIDVDELIYLQKYNANISDPEDDDYFNFSSDDDDDLFEFPLTNTNISTQNNQKFKKPDLTNDQKNLLIQRLLTAADSNFNIPHGAVTKVANEVGCHRTTASKLWNFVKRELAEFGRVEFNSRKPGRVGRKPKVFDEEFIKAIPQKYRTTIRSFASALGVSPGCVVKMMKRGIIRSHTSSIKPSLTHNHKLTRLQWIFSHIIPRFVHQTPRFECLMNIVHIDEKWFWLSKITHRFYLLAGEEEPIRTTQNKNFIPKCMFLAAIARPHFGVNGECTFDGKIGIWPFTEICTAKRTSANRPAGTVKEKALQSITRPIIRNAILHQLIPAIKAKWPSSFTKCIWIQQDNARPHISTNDSEFLEAANTNGFEMHLICQPAQSPDLNVLNLG